MNPFSPNTFDDWTRSGHQASGWPQPDRQRGRNGGRGKPKNKDQSGMSGGTGDDASPVTTPGTTTAYAVQDPAAWMRSNMAAAGLSGVNDATNYGRFLNDAIVQPFVAGWDEWKASHPTSTQDFWDYARGSGMGLPDAVTGGPPPAPGAEAPQPMGFNAFVQQETGKGKQQLGRHGRRRLHNAYDAYVTDFQAPKQPTPPSAVAPAGFKDFNTWLQDRIDSYTPQQQGRFDAGKRPGSIRVNLFA